MNKSHLILKYFQKKDQLTITNREYQETLSSLFKWLVTNDKVTNDKTSKYFPNIICSAKIISKDKGTLAGIEEIEYLLKSHTSLSFKPRLSDGQEFKEKDIIAQISGKSHEILAYERTILNIFQRLSGITTETSRLLSLLKLLKSLNPPFLAATRKTPWMSLDKKAVAVGGGLTHRLNLSDGILIKDNHLKLITSLKEFCRETMLFEHAHGPEPRPFEEKAGRIWEVRKKAMDDHSKIPSQLIEIEVTTEKQAHQAIKTFQPFSHSNHLAILLDNFSPSRARTLLSHLGNLYDLSSIIFEASGGIDERNIKGWAKTGLDILSLGSLTHSAKAANFSLEF